MMKLDTLNRLTLHDTVQALMLAGILLDPGRKGTFISQGSVCVKGVLRVNPAGTYPWLGIPE